MRVSGSPSCKEKLRQRAVLAKFLVGESDAAFYGAARRCGNYPFADFSTFRMKNSTRKASFFSKFAKT